MMRQTRRTVTAALIMAASIAMAGCTSSASSTDADVVAQLQEQVLSISVAIADENWESASDDLDALDSAVTTALERNEIDAARADAIREAIDLVRADLDDALETEPEPTESATPDKPGNGNGGNGSDNGKKP